jgi:hypothetical protein
MASAAPSATSPYIVVLKDGVAHPANVARRHEANRGAQVSHIYGVAIKGYSAELTPGALKAIRQDPNVDYVERDGAIHPDSQLTGTQVKRVYANLANLHIDENDVPQDRVNADIAILDTGVAEHNDLNIAGRVDCVGHGGSCVSGGSDLAGHGTHVAGDAAAVDNGIGVVGTAPGARIWSVKVIAGMGSVGPDEVGNGATPFQSGNAQMSDAIAGINWVTANSSVIEVANMSFDCTTEEGGCAHTALAQALATSVNSGVVWVAAAGYESGAVNGDFKSYPALLPDVITVSAMADYDGLPGSLSSPKVCASEANWPQHDDRLSAGDGTWGSNFGPEVDIAAPGTCILSTYKEGKYAILSGSSMASGLVAGAAADIAAQSNPNNRADVESIRSTLLSAGNYNWEDLHVDPVLGLVSPDNSKEPLLDMSKIATPAKAPSASTNPAVNVGTTTATLNGWVYPERAPTSYYFEYGTTTAYGTSLPAPAGSAGSGSSAVYLSYDISGLEPETTYHYRILAYNSLGSSIGADQTFTTPAATPGSPSVLLDQGDDQMWVHSRAASSGALQYANWKSSTGWANVNLGTQMRAGSQPAAVLDKITKQQWVYFVAPDGTLKYWNWNGATGGWKEYALPSSVKTNTSPAVAFDQSTKQQWVYYVDPSGTLKLWNWTSANGWVSYNLGPAVAPATSPTVSFDESTKESSVYFVRPDMTIGQMQWTGATGWRQATLGGSVRARTSPNVVLHLGSKQQWVYFIAADGALKYFNYNPASGWSLFALSATVAAGSSPTAIIDPATYQQWVYYVEPGGNIGYWNWTSANGWKPYALPASAVPGTSLAAALDLNSKQQWVYYRDSGGSIFYWNWNAAAGGWKRYP